MASSTQSELQARFASTTTSVEVEADVLAELQSIMRLYSISVDELWYKWESYSMKMDANDLKLDVDTARNLKKDIQAELERESRNKAHQLQMNRRGVATPRASMAVDVLGMFALGPNTPMAGSAGRGKGKASNLFGTPSMSRVKAELLSSPPDLKTPQRQGESLTVTRFDERPNAGQAIYILHDHLPEIQPPMAPFAQSRIKLVANSDMKKLSYKPMAMKSSEASEILDDKIDEYMILIQKHHQLEDSVFGSAASQSTHEIVAVGRIASESLEGRLNASSIVLEMSRRMGAGIRISLNVEAVPAFQFFPGQVVALKGINASGEYFTVHEILQAPLLPSAASTFTGLEDHIQRLRGGPDAMESDLDPAPLVIMLGAGPYTADDNLDFEPLHALCGHAANLYVDALILTGPFLDIDHPLIASGDFDLPEDAVPDTDTATMATLFRYLISPVFMQLVAANPHITIILVPSVKDVISKHVSWPQEPFPRRELGLPKTVRIIGNPMTFSLNEIAIGISSQDILTELRLSEAVGPMPKDSSLFARIPKYIIEQRNFFPLFPAVDRERLPKTGTLHGRPCGAMLDTSYLKLGELINVRPDIMILPSALQPFAEVVDSVVVINPGFLSKRKSPGSYAKLTIEPPSLRASDHGPAVIAHRVFDRLRVEIRRI